MPAEKSAEGSTSAKYQWYQTRDKKALLFCCIEPKFWQNFCRAIGRDDLVETHDENQPVDFGGGEVELRRELQDVFHTRDLADWVELAAEHDIAMGPAPVTINEAKDDPHLATRHIIVDDDHPQAGPFTYVGEAAKVRGQPYEVRYPAPLLGEHTRQILAGELGLSEAELERLSQDKII